MSPASQTAAELIREARQLLSDAGFSSAGLDAEVLLRDALRLSREDLYMRMADPVSDRHADDFRARIQQRIAGMPVAYITGKREFYGREFIVSPAVLVPRPETELLVERSLDWIRKQADGRYTVVDVGTGSGAIAVSIATETSGNHAVIASDVSLDALQIARRNRDRHETDVQLVAGSLLNWCRGPVDLIAANLPYLRPDQAHDGLRHEPEIALFAGNDGFALNGQVIEQAAEVLDRPGLLIMEIDPDQAKMAEALAKRVFPGQEIRVEPDLAGLDRLLIARRT